MGSRRNGPVTVFSYVLSGLYFELSPKPETLTGHIFAEVRSLIHLSGRFGVWGFSVDPDPNFGGFQTESDTYVWILYGLYCEGLIIPPLSSPNSTRTNLKSLKKGLGNKGVGIKAPNPKP